MHVTAASTTSDVHNDRLQRREQAPLNRFSSSSAKPLPAVGVARLFTFESIGNLSENENDQRNETVTYACDRCPRVLASEYGFEQHMNMYHPNQSILCTDCQLTFRSHRALKGHQQRFHASHSASLSNYQHFSSCLFIAFSTRQFPLVAKTACEQGRLPLGQLTSKLFPCPICHLSFPCSKALTSHSLQQHEQYEYQACKGLLHDLISRVEENLQSDELTDQHIDRLKLVLSKQASQLGLVDKQLARELRRMKHEHHRLIYPTCPHLNRTCANLCLDHLSSYHKLIDNYPYQISTGQKGSPFAQGSIVAKPAQTSSTSALLASKDALLANPKRTPLKRFQSSLSERSSSPQSKRRMIEHRLQAKEMISTSPKKTYSKAQPSYTRSSSSMSSSSSISTRAPSKLAKHRTSGSLRRSSSPVMALAAERSLERRRRPRQHNLAKASASSPDTTPRMDGDTEQENGDAADEVTTAKRSRSKRQREASNSSVEYVQILHNEPQTVSSLNNIENLKLKPKNEDKDIIICESPPALKKPLPSSNKQLSKTSVNGHQAADYDEHVRVRCKICGDILEGRSRFSNHVLTMHSQLIKSNMSSMKQQQPTVVR